MNKFLLSFFLILLACPNFAGAGQTEKNTPFLSMTFDAACAAARKDQKVVLIDFFTTWCGPCKMLDQTTWKDQQVQAWLKEKTIPLKIDAEKEVELASKYTIRAYPTILLVKPDGTEIDRLVGYRQPDGFLLEAKDALAGKDSIARAKEKLVGDKQNSPMLHMQLARAYADKSRPKEALDEYLWCYDHGAEYDQSFASARTSYLIPSIARLGYAYPPALDALKLRRDNLEPLLFAGTIKEFQIMEYAALNTNLKDAVRPIEVFDKLKLSGAKASKTRITLGRTMLDPLLDARRYNDLLEAFPDLQGEIEHSLKTFELTLPRLSAQPQFSKADLENYKHHIAASNGKYYEVLLGVGKTEEASNAAERLIKFDGSGKTFAVLIGHAVHAEKYEIAQNLAQAGLKAVPNEDQAAVQKAMQTIPKGK